MFERFSDRARRVVVLAQEESRMLNHTYIGSEHILLGLLHETDGLAAKALEAVGVSLEAARDEVRRIVEPGQHPPAGHIPLTPNAKKVLEQALREALGIGDRHIGTEHILLGLIRVGEGVGIQVLFDLGVTPMRVKARVLELVRDITDPVADPVCARCSAPLKEHARVAPLQLAVLDGDDVVDVRALFCTRCGATLGTVRGDAMDADGGHAHGGPA